MSEMKTRRPLSRGIAIRLSLAAYRRLGELQRALGAEQTPCPVAKVTQAAALEWALENARAPELPQG